MKPNTSILPTLLLFLLPACQSALPAGDRIGERMRPAEIHRLAVVDATPAEFFEQTLLVEANVVAVCQSMGCWMKVEDEGHSAMVRWEAGCGGQYTFPKDAVGKRILIQGSFYPKLISEEEAKHLQEEAGGELEVERETYEFNASAVIVYKN